MARSKYYEKRKAGKSIFITSEETTTKKEKQWQIENKKWDKVQKTNVYTDLSLKYALYEKLLAMFIFETSISFDETFMCMFSIEKKNQFAVMETRYGVLLKL